MGDNRTFKLVLIAVLGGVALAGVIAFETADRPQPVQSAMPAATSSQDHLDAELARCRALGPNDPVDVGCEAAWAESNRRFFGDDKSGR